MGSIADNRSAPDAPSPSHVPTGAASQGDLARRMVERVIRGGPASHAEALSALRSAFPESPLTVRVAALAMLIGRAGADRRPG